jgi:polar amino acid transport system substrate-binding protein
MTTKRSLLRGAAAALALAFGAGAATAQDCPVDLPTVTPGKLTMSTNATIPPVQYIDSAGNLQGLHPELGREIAKRLCLEPEFMNVGFEVQIPGLANARWDMVNTGMFYTEERAKIMRLVPYSVNSLAIVVERGNPLGVTGYAELAGHPIGTEIAGFADALIRSVNDEQVAAGMPSMRIQAFNTYAETFAALSAGQVRGVFIGAAPATYYAEQGRFDVGATGLSPGSPAAFGFDGASGEAIAEAVAQALREMVADGTYHDILGTYGVTPIEVWAEYSGDIAVYYAPE